MAPSRGAHCEQPKLRPQHLRVLSTPGVRLFIGFLTLFTLFLLYGSLNFYRDPGSIFYNENRAFVRWYSAYRQRQADTFIDAAAEFTRSRYQDQYNPNFPKASENASICAVLLTTHDRQEQQFETSLGSMLDGLTSAERADLSLQVFFANSDPSRHPSWYSPWLRHLVDRVYTYADLYSFEGMADVLSMEHTQPRAVAKDPLDYALAMQQCYATTTARYIAIFEDDVIAAQGWCARTILAAREIEVRRWEEGKAGQWLYLRIFNEESSLGWASKKIGSNNEVQISLVLSGVAAAILLLIRRQLQPCPSKSYVDKWPMVVICCIAIPSFVILFFQAGKASVLPPSPGVKEEVAGCCAQALVLNREQIPELMQHLHGYASMGRRDALVSDFASQRDLAKYTLYPILTQHLGVRSEPNFGEFPRIWSMGFESLNPRQLAREHADSVRRLYGDGALS